MTKIDNFYVLTLSRLENLAFSCEYLHFILIESLLLDMSTFGQSFVGRNFLPSILVYVPDTVVGSVIGKQVRR
jgi:hypothetical protein